MRDGRSAEAQEDLDDALLPPNLVDQNTGLPFAWGEGADELDGLEALLA